MSQMHSFLSRLQAILYMCWGAGGAESPEQMLQLMMQRVLELQEAMSFSQQQLTQSLGPRWSTENLRAAASSQPPMPAIQPSLIQQQDDVWRLSLLSAGISPFGSRADVPHPGLSQAEQQTAPQMAPASKPAQLAKDVAAGAFRHVHATGAISRCSTLRFCDTLRYLASSTPVKI